MAYIAVRSCSLKMSVVLGSNVCTGFGFELNLTTNTEQIIEMQIDLYMLVLHDDCSSKLARGLLCRSSGL